MQDFKYKLSYENWDSVFGTEDTNIMYNSFFNSFLRIFSSRFPLKKLVIKSNNNPWITPDIRISCKHKRDLYLLYRNSNNEALKIPYRWYCKILKDVIREAEKQYYNGQVLNSSNKIKTVWDITKSVIGKLTEVQELKVNGEVISNRQDIAHTLNRFFLFLAAEVISNRQDIADSLNSFFLFVAANNTNKNFKTNSKPLD
jgi:hypothetical protein